MAAICESCEGCKYWQAQVIQGKGGAGFCRCSFPQVSEYLIAKIYGEGLRGAELSLKASFWPASLAGDSCGKFQQQEVG
jgi:hypothetical protein